MQRSLTITENEIELRGATARNSPKPAITDTGLTLTVIPFVKIEETVIVKTVDGRYIKLADE